MFPTRPLMLFFAVLAAFIIGQSLAMQLPVLAQAAIIITQLVIILGGALVYRRWFAHAGVRWLKLKSMGTSLWGMAAVVAASVSLGLLANALGALTVHLFPGLAPMAEAYQEQTEMLLLPETLEARILGIIAVTVVAPVAEEFLFRGTILAEQNREQFAFSAILLNGILFSLMHLNPVAFLSLAVVGCYFAHVALKSGSLWPAIVGHAALNLVNGVVLMEVADEVPEPTDISLFEIGVALVVLVPVTAGLWWLSIYLTGEDYPLDPSGDSVESEQPKQPREEQQESERRVLRERPEPEEEDDDVQW